MKPNEMPRDEMLREIGKLLAMLPDSDARDTYQLITGIIIGQRLQPQPAQQTA